MMGQGIGSLAARLDAMENKQVQMEASSKAALEAVQGQLEAAAAFNIALAAKLGMNVPDSEPTGPPCTTFAPHTTNETISHVMGSPLNLFKAVSSPPPKPNTIGSLFGLSEMEGDDDMEGWSEGELNPSPHIVEATAKCSSVLLSPTPVALPAYVLPSQYACEVSMNLQSAPQKGVSFVHDNHVQVVGNCPSATERQKHILILDLNGLLCESRLRTREHLEPTVTSRPGCQEFLDRCLQIFDVGVWSSMSLSNVLPVVKALFRGKQPKMVLHQDYCDQPVGMVDPLNPSKTVMYKNLCKFWKDYSHYNPTNTLLVDDSPLTCLPNPANNCIFPYPWKLRDQPNCKRLMKELLPWLEGVSKAAHIPEYVSGHPYRYGQPNYLFNTAAMGSGSQQSAKASEPGLPAARVPTTLPPDATTKHNQRKVRAKDSMLGRVGGFVLLMLLHNVCHSCYSHFLIMCHSICRW